MERAYTPTRDGDGDGELCHAVKVVLLSVCKQLDPLFIRVEAMCFSAANCSMPCSPLLLFCDLGKPRDFVSPPSLPPCVFMRGRRHSNIHDASLPQHDKEVVHVPRLYSVVCL